MRKNLLIVMLLLAAITLHAQTIVVSRTVDKVQPMTGLVLWNDQSEDLNNKLGSCFALEYTYCAPCKVVTGKSNGKIQYDWTFIENILNGVKSRGHQAILRFYYEYPGEEMGCSSTKGATGVPDYIKALSGYKETSKSTDDGKCYYADWSNSELQWFVKQFITDFAAKYDHDPRIAFLEVGFGHWGEYHIYGGPSLSLGNNFPSKAFQTSFLQHIDTTLHVLPWSISIDASDDQCTPIVDSPSLMALHFGLFDDSFMHEEHDKSQGEGYNEECWDAMGSTRWQTSACGGEISYYEDKDQHNFLNPAGMYGVTWEQASAKYHISFMICNDAPEGKYATATRFKEGSMACGYRFRLTECSVRGNQTAVTFTNEGIAPIYKDAYPAIGTTRSATSLKGLLPGQSRTCMIDAVLTRADDLTITSDYILPSQQIQFNANAIPTDLSTAPTLNDPSNKSQSVSTGSAIAAITFTASGTATSISVSNLPAGLTSNTNGLSLTISGTPTASGTYTVTATNASGATATKQGTISVSSTPGPGPTPQPGEHSFTWSISDPAFADLAGDITSTTTVNGLTMVATSGSKMTIDEQEAKYGFAEGDTVVFTNRLKTGGSGKADYRHIKFSVTGPCTIEVWAKSGSSSKDRTINIYTNSLSSDNLIGTLPALKGDLTKQSFTYTGGPATIVMGSDNSGINFYAINIVYPLPTALDPATEPLLPNKLIRHGQLFILHHGRYYNVLGQPLY